MKRKRQLGGDIIDEITLDTLNEIFGPDIEQRMKKAGFKIEDRHFLRGKKFDKALKEQALLDMPCSATIQ